MIARLLAASAVALAVAAPGAQTFKTTAELVTVPVTVTSRNGTAQIDGLTAEDFRLLEDGVAQTITLVDRERRPVSLCIVLDSSNSMKGHKQRLAGAVVERIIAGLQPVDEVSLVVFATQPDLALSWTPARDVPFIDWALWKAAGWTALVDALRMGLGLIGDARNPRPVILVVSDGEETGSVTPLSHVVTTRRQSETLVYAMRVVGWPALGPDPPMSADATTPSGPQFSRVCNVLPALVGDSGEVVYSVQVEQHVVMGARAFLEELQSQYTLGYVPTKAPDGKYRRIKIEMRDKTHKARHRGGYLAIAHTP